MRLFGRRKPEPLFLTDAFRDSLLERVEQVAPPDDKTKIVFASWLTGAVFASNGLLRSIPELSAAWTGAQGQAEGVERVLTLAMLSRFARWAWKPRFDGLEYSESITASATNVCNFFGGSSFEQVEEFLLLHEQFNADRDFNDRVVGGTEDRSLRHTEVELIVGLVAQELGRPLPVPLHSLQLPVEDVFDLLLAGWRFACGDNVEAFIAAPLILMDAEIIMKTMAAES